MYCTIMKIHKLSNNIVVHEYDNNIYIIKNLITPIFCSKLVNIMKQLTMNNSTEYGINSNVLTYYLSIFDICKLSEQQLTSSEDNETLEILLRILLSVYIRLIAYIINTINTHIFNNQIPKFNDIVFRKVHGPTRKHIDGTYGGQDARERGQDRLLTCIIAFNDNYTEGDIYFPNNELKLKLDTGDILLFPPYWTNPHYTTKPIGDYRYTSTFWFLSPETDRISLL